MITWQSCNEEWLLPTEQQHLQVMMVMHRPEWQLMQFIQIMGISVLDLFDHSSTPTSTSPSSSCALLWGPPNCGKNSLLLQFAYNCALRSEGTVTFICRPHTFDLDPPCLSQGVDVESEAFARVTIKYIEDDEQLRKHFAAFHVQDRLPRAVIVDDFYDLFNERSCAERFGHTRGRETAMVKTLALCHDAINYANECLGPEQRCHLLVSDSHVGETPRLRFIYQRWLSQIFSITALDFSRFSVSDGKVDEGNGNKVLHAKYSLQHNRLHLEAIEYEYTLQ